MGKYPLGQLMAQRRMRELKRAKGICTYKSCKDKATERNSMCQKHVDQMREYSRRRKKK